MDNFLDSFAHPVLTVGKAAATVMRERFERQVDGTVVAVFASTFYLQVGGRLICVGHAGLEPGPLNCITSAPATIDWQASGLQVETRVRVTPTAIRVGNAFQFPLSDFECWQAPKSALPDAINLSRGIASFRRAIAGRSDLDGLGYFCSSGFAPESQRFVHVAAKDSLFDASRWLEAAFRQPRSVRHVEAAWIQNLCGLGPGLTPSGDDFLGGMLLALDLLNEVELNQGLWRMIENHARKATNPISLAHLSAAADGLQGATIHRVMTAVSSGRGDQVALTADDLSRVGHSSGWDIMAGVVTCLEAWLRVAYGEYFICEPAARAKHQMRASSTQGHFRAAINV